MCESAHSPSSSLPSLQDSGDVWGVVQHLAAADGFPFQLQLDEVQVCIDYAAAHYNCCWARAMLHPIWDALQAHLREVKAKKMGSDASPHQTLESSASAARAATCKTLTELSESIQLLFKQQQQQQQRPPCGSVNRLRYINHAPPVLRVGRGITGTLTVTFSLRRCSDTGVASTALFPSFLAVEPSESIASFVTISVFETRRRSSTCKIALLLLQIISSDGNVATYSTFDAELQIGAPSLSSLQSSSALPWAFRVYAAFYASSEEQLQLDEPFTHLCEWRPKVTQEERFAVMNPRMDPEVAFSTEKRHRATMERRIRTAIARMDGSVEAGNGTLPPLRATLRHIATLRTSRGVAMETCTHPGGRTLAAVMPRDVAWPLRLQLMLGDVAGKTWCSSPIPGSSSLERLACEVNKLGEQVSADEEEV
ncbi:hypothetical protein DQ04_00151260 [Trypanosoma grayi]|uniref:hypothetical protein n=1 Tax=Trypanosoma grayi TaxID=71804 RepID=UPI0004F3F468|nr:hypothetical protein DQ04_00151260 [Trypanosoma grayi]KEG15207.1 hypothetical protein DQ04_00151260 [Trypanosoma grayi]